MIEFKQLAESARANHKRAGAGLFVLSELPAPLCYFSEGSAALAAQVAIVQAHASIPVTGEIDAATIGALKPAPPIAEKKKATKRGKK